MKRRVAQEFKNLRFKDTLDPFVGACITWESPRLGTMFPADNAKKGSDRAVCHTVNGVLEVRVNNPVEAFDFNYIDVPEVYVTAGLYSEYAGLVGAISSTSYPINPSDLYEPNNIYALSTNGRLGFSFFNSYANLAQSIFIRLTIANKRISANEETRPRPFDITCYGALIGSDIRVM